MSAFRLVKFSGARAGMFVGAIATAMAFTSPAAAIECPATMADVPASTTPAQMAEIARCCWGKGGDGCGQKAAESELTCGKLRVMAYDGRINAGTPEGQAAIQLEQEKCPGKPDDAPVQAQPQNPSTNTPQPTYVNGVFRGERGYYNQYSGAKKKICEPYYAFTMVVRNGRAEFTSGGHTWTGVINANGNIIINEDGVYPRPKNTTAIIGPVEDASLYNGYCGNGFFRIVGPA